MRGKRLGVLALAALVLAARPARAVEKEAVNAAIEHGVRNLKAEQQDSGIWPQNEIGLTALCGLTLMECGVPTDDARVQKAAAAVRRMAPTMGQTYSLALSILFLDRLGEPVDVALIESLTVRLLAGQTVRGGWTYTCPALAQEEQRRLTTLVKERLERGPDKDAPKLEPGTRTVKDLPQIIQVQLEQVARQRVAGGADQFDFPGDNSNTQFAVLGLWVARRYGLPVDGALGMTERRFRQTVRADGGWDYSTAVAPVPVLGPGSTPAMTCAGLLGIGLAYGAWNDAALRTEGKGKDPDKPAAPAIKPQDPSKDRVVVGAFRLLGQWVDGMAAANRDRPPRIDTNNGKFYYFLWSLERVCVAYGPDKIGQTDWYDWGAEILLANQGPDGGWSNGAYATADTCFALLFLRRANLAQDLTRALKSQMKDGMQSSLRQGGIGGQELVKGRRPFFDRSAGEDREKPATDADAQAARLGKQLASAGEDRQEQLLKELRDSKGAAYTQALADAIPKLDGEAKKRARGTLADRLSRMTPETLEVKLADNDAEVRRAAALAVAMKEDKAHTYQLIELLGDDEATVSRAAYAALKSLTGQDFGPAKDAGRAERVKAIRAWKEWWARQGGKK
jgi:hypothetical protein